MPVATYQRKPSQIEAVQWTGDNLDELKDFAGEKLIVMQEGVLSAPASLGVWTAHGGVPVELSAWIATRVPAGSADFYPITDSEFHTLYEPVN